MRGTPKLLPLADWPAADRRLWEAAFRPGDLLDDTDRPGSQWSEGSRRSVGYSYRRWLGYLTLADPAGLALAPARRVTAERVQRYVAHLQETIAPAGTHSYVKHLYDAMRVMAPEQDWLWLKALCRALPRLVRPTGKRHRVVPVDELLDLGIRLMQDAETAHPGQSRVQAADYRDGLVIALLASRPIRRRNLAMIRIGRHLLRDGAGFRLCFAADETKTRRPLDLDLPALLTPYLDAYLTHWRAILPGAATHDGLWTSAKGGPLTDSALYDCVRRRTERAFGRAINLHLFRDCAATTIALHDPANVRMAAALLGHASFSTTETHYIQAGRIQATQAHRQAIVTLRDRLRPASRRRRPL